MRNALIGTVSVIVLYLIFVTGIETSYKNLIVGVGCSAILMFYIFRQPTAGSMSNSSWILVSPTIVLMASLIGNVAFDWQLGTVAIWLSYIGLTAIAYIFAARLQ